MTFTINRTLIYTLIAVLSFSCGETQKTGENGFLSHSDSIDIPEIKKRGKLVAATSYSSTSYFIYRGQPMGYEYELLERLADHLNVELEIKVIENMDSIYQFLMEGEADIIAHNLTITKERKEKMAFTHPHTLTKQVLVQRKPKNWRGMMLHQIEDELIRNPIDLIGKKVHVRKNSAYYQRLQHLSEEIGGDIDIVEAPGRAQTEELIRMVAAGEIEYTVADQNLAYISKTYYSNLDVKTAVSFPQRVAWAVRKSSPELLAAVNNWIDGMKQQADYYVIYNKYFKDRKGFQKRIKSPFFSKTGGQISRYDDIIQQEAEKLNWDWRLLASLIYQESNFKEDAKSWAGAIGLMQVLPATAQHYGIENPHPPHKNVRAGVAYLEYLKEYWSNIPDSVQRIKFVMASYNVGQGHVSDAKNLAEKYDHNPLKWDDNVEKFMLLKAKPEYYNDEVVKHGYCRGEEPYSYVQEIFKRYDHYSKFIPREPQAQLTQAE